MPRVLSSGGSRTLVESFGTRSDTFAKWSGSTALADLGVTPVGMYRSQVWVRACVDTLAMGLSMLPLKFYERSEDGDDRKRVRAQNSSLAELFANPVPGELSTMDLVEHIESELGIHSRAAAVLSRPAVGAEPDMIIPLMWERLAFHNGSWRYFVPGDGSYELRREDLILWRYYRGVPVVETLADTLRLEIEAKKYSAASFANGVRPSGALIAPNIRDEEQRKDLQRMLDARHAGSENNFRALVLTGQADWKQFSGSASDAQLVDLRQLTRTECAAGYRIAPPIVGILDDATYSNIDTQYKMHFRITLGPRVKKFEETLRVQLIQKEPRWRDARLYGEFDMDAVLRASIQERAEAYVKLIQTGYTINGIRKLENEERIDHPLADTAFFPANLRPVSDDAWSITTGGVSGSGPQAMSQDTLLNMVAEIIDGKPAGVSVAVPS